MSLYFYISFLLLLIKRIASAHSAFERQMSTYGIDGQTYITMWTCLTCHLQNTHTKEVVCFFFLPIEMPIFFRLRRFAIMKYK